MKRANAATWKSRTIATNAILALISTALALGKAFGFKLELDGDTLQGLAAGALASVSDATVTTPNSAPIGGGTNNVLVKSVGVSGAVVWLIV